MTTVNSATSETITYTNDISPSEFFHGNVDVTLSDEVTNDCDAAIAALPAYSGDYEPYFCDPAASKSSNDDACSISRSRYKFTWETPLESDCTIHWIERTFDGDGNPIGDVEMSEDVSAGSTESSVYEVLEPSGNGTVSVLLGQLGYCCYFGDCYKVPAEISQEDCEGFGGTFTSTGGCTDADPCVDVVCP